MANDRNRRGYDEDVEMDAVEEYEEYEDGDNIIELYDEDGNAIQLEHIMTFELEDVFYVAFLPIDEEDEEANEVIFMRLDEDEDGGDVFFTIDSEEELEKVWETFLAIYEEEEEDE